MQVAKCCMLSVRNIFLHIIPLHERSTIVTELLQNVTYGSVFFWKVVLHDGCSVPDVLRQHVGHIFNGQKSMKNGHF